MCVVPAPAKDARIADRHSSSSLGLDGTKGLSEVVYQPVAGSQIQQAETCPLLSKRSSDSQVVAIQGLSDKKGLVLSCPIGERQN